MCDVVDGEVEKFVNLFYLFVIVLCEIIVDGYNMNVVFGECIEINRSGSDKGFVFFGVYFGNFVGI